jgi:PAS domain S-box-containing protein
MALPLDLAPDGIVVVDGNARVVVCNRQAESLFGYAPGAMAGLPLDSLIPEEHQAAHRLLHQAFFAEPSPRLMGEGRTLTGRRSDGSTFPVQISLSVIRRDDRAFALTAVRDGTTAVRAQTLLEEATADLEEAQRIARLGSWRWNPTTSTREWSAGTYAIHGRDPADAPQTTEQALGSVHADDLPRVRAAYERMLAGSESFELDYRVLIHDRGWRTVHAIARPDPDRPGWYSGTLQDITERHAIEQALRERTEALDRILDSAPIGMAIARTGGQFVRVNQALCTMLGYTQEELLSMTFAQITHPHEREASVAAHASLTTVRRTRQAMHKRYLRSDGRSIWANAFLATITDDDGRPTGVIAQIQDITAEREAADNRARLDAVVGSASDAMLTSTTDGIITSWNPAAEHVFGYTPQEAIGQHTSFLASSPSDHATIDACYASVGAGKTVPAFEAVRRRAAGTLVDVTIAMSPITAPDGSVLGVLGIIRDITAEKAARHELELGRARLERAELTAHMGSWEWDLTTNAVQWSAGLYALFALDPADATLNVEHGLAHRAHPDDRDRVRRAITDAVEQLIPIHRRHRIIRGDGRVRTVELHAEPIVDAAGQAARIVGAVRDITDELHTHDALAAASANLSAYAQELQRLAVRHLDPDSPPPPALTERQLDILQLIAQGLTTRAIAEQMFLSQPTIKWHVKQILAKTGAANRTEAVARVLGATPPN